MPAPANLRQSKEPQMTGKNGATRSRLSAIFGSITVWLLIILVAFDLFISYAKPLRYVRIRNMILSDSVPLGDKFRAFTSAYNKANILLLGSSLLADPASLTDMKQWKFKLNDRDSYSEARYFDQCFEQRLKLPAHSYNMAIGGAMVSEYRLLLQKSIESGKIPGCVFLFLAPRDFIDHYHFFGTGSRAYQYFQQCEPISKFRMTHNLKHDIDILAVRSWTFYRLKGDYNRVASSLACNLLNRAPDLYSAQQQSVAPGWSGKSATPTIEFLRPQQLSRNDDERLPDSVVAADLNAYRNYYLPVDRKHFGLELGELADIVQLASANNIVPIVVNMPLTKNNLDILPAQFQADYNDSLRSLCREHNVDLVDFQNDTSFTDKDFRDSVHLNTAGGIKLFNALVNSLAQDPQTISRLRKALASTD